MKSSNWTAEVAAVFVKDLRSELRTRYSINALLMFAVTTLVVVSFSLGTLSLQTEIQAALYWIVIFFSSMSALAGVFIREEEAKTANTLRMFARSSVVYSGKLLFNITLLALLATLITPLYIIFMNVSLANWGLFLLIVFLGVIGLASATTIIGAIVAKSAVRGALFAVLSFPVLLPLLVVAIKATNTVLNDLAWAGVASEIKLLVAYIVIMITLSSLLFDFVYNG